MASQDIRDARDAAEGPLTKADGRPKWKANVLMPNRGKSKTSRLDQKMLALADEIEKPNAYIGQAAFLAFGFLFELKILVWLGSNLVELNAVYAPWAGSADWQEAPLEVVVCKCAPPGSTNHSRVSSYTPLSKCNHYVAARIEYCLVGA